MSSLLWCQRQPVTQWQYYAIQLHNWSGKSCSTRAGSQERISQNNQDVRCVPFCLLVPSKNVGKGGRLEQVQCTLGCRCWFVCVCIPHFEFWFTYLLGWDMKAPVPKNWPITFPWTLVSVVASLVILTCTSWSCVPPLIASPGTMHRTQCRNWEFQIVLTQWTGSSLHCFHKGSYRAVRNKCGDRKSVAFGSVRTEL